MSKITNPNQAIQSDATQAVDSGQMVPTVTTGSGNPPLQSAQNGQPPVAPAPNAPNAPNSRPTQGPQVQPQGPNAQPNQPQPPKPNLRARIFDTILKAGAGQPIQGPNGQPIPLTKGFMGKAILANALAGMMAGYGSEETVNTAHGPVRVNNPAKGFAAGAQAGNQQQQQRQQQMTSSISWQLVVIKSRQRFTRTPMLRLTATALGNLGMISQTTLRVATLVNFP